MNRLARLGLLMTLLVLISGGCSEEKSDSSASADTEILYWRSPMDPSFVSKGPGKDAMGMDLVPVRKGDPGADLGTLELSGMVTQRIGVRTAPVGIQQLQKTIRGVARVTYDETKLSRVNLKYDGWVEELYVDETGTFVESGQKLFSIYSPELVASAAEFLQVLGRAQAGSHMEHLSRAARARLRQFDLSDQQIDAIAESGDVPKHLVVYSPRKGYVVNKSIVEGSFVRRGIDLFDIADLSTVWINVDIYEFEVPWVHVGQEMKAELSYLPGQDFDGVVDFIYPFLNMDTRTVQVRAVFPNPDLILKPGMFATGFISSVATDPTIVVPSEAVIHEGDRNVVFVSLGDGRFESRELTLGSQGDGGDFAVMDGIEEGEHVVLSGQFLIDSESRLKAVAARMLGADPVPGSRSTDSADSLTHSGQHR